MLITVQQNPSWQLSLAQLSPSLFYSFYWILFFFISFSLNYFYFILYILIIFHIIWFLTLHLGPLDDIVTLYLELPDYLTVYLGPPDDIWPYTWGHKMTFDLIHGAARWYLTLYLFPPFSPPVTTFSNRRSARIKKLNLLKLLRTPKKLGVNTFPNHLGHFGAPGGHYGFQGYPPFLIEGVLGSRNLISESCLERPKILK